MRKKSRVRWSANERDALVRRCQSLHAAKPQKTAEWLLEEGQRIFPPERRRTNNAVLRKWLMDELKRAPASAPGEVTVWRAPGVEEAPEGADAYADEMAGAVPSLAPSTPAPATVAPAAPSLVAGVVEAGVQVLVGILGDPRVKSVFAGLLRSMAVDESTAAAQGTPGTQGSAPGADGSGLRDGSGAPAGDRRWVVVAGLPSEEVSAVERALEGTLPVRFWSSDQPREQLQDWLDDARLVIGMGGFLTPAIESSLQRLGERYVHHGEGIPALYRRLASEALR